MLSLSILLACKPESNPDAERVCAAGPVLNEASASNKHTRLDADGDSVDWIEVTNPTAEPIDLAGYALSDSDKDGPEWTFPSYLLDPGAPTGRA